MLVSNYLVQRLEGLACGDRAMWRATASLLCLKKVVSCDETLPRWLRGVEKDPSRQEHGSRVSSSSLSHCKLESR